MKYGKLSKFGQFVVDLRGYNLYKGSRPLDKWEAFEMTNKTARDIIDGKCRITAMINHDYVKFMNRNKTDAEWTM